MTRIPVFGGAWDSTGTGSEVIGVEACCRGCRTGMVSGFIIVSVFFVFLLGIVAKWWLRLSYVIPLCNVKLWARYCILT